MKVMDQEFQAGRITAKLKETSIDMLENLPSNEGVEAAKLQIKLAEKLRECNGVMDIEPEEAVLMRQLINKHPNLPPAIQVGMYEAFNPTEPDE